MKIRLSSRANREFQLAADYLIESNPVAAREFGLALERLFTDLRLFPKLGYKTDVPGVRVKTLKRFRYKVFYEVHDDAIAILSIFHTSRDPDEI